MSRIIRQATKIILIRHAEKPSNFPRIYGVTSDGEHEKDALSVRGWQRAGALVPLFTPANGIFQHPLLARPQFLFASKPSRHHGSWRPFETIIPLSEKLEIGINAEYAKAEAKEMADRALECSGTVLICWYHENISIIANRILGDTVTAPQNWPDHLYDMIWIFERESPTSDRYRFNQIPQNLLAGDVITMAV